MVSKMAAAACGFSFERAAAAASRSAKLSFTSAAMLS
jgi:hypothetical protein